LRGDGCAPWVEGQAQDLELEVSFPFFKFAVKSWKQNFAEKPTCDDFLFRLWQDSN